MKIRRRKIRLVLLGLAALSAVTGCNSTEMVSERGFEDKVERLRVGETNRSETEALLGPANSVERNRLTYYFADTEFGIGIRRYTPPSGALPIAAGAFPSNTRGVIIVSFNDAGNLKQVAVERYFEPPFINDYTYLIKDAAKEPLDAIAQIAAANGFKALDMNKGNGTVTLQDNETKAQIRVILAGQALRLISSNPHSRLSSEYRLYARRQSNVTSAIASAEWVQ